MLCGVSNSPGFFQSACTRFPFSKPCVHVCVHVCAQVFVHTYTRGPLEAHQPELRFCLGVSDVIPSRIILSVLYFDVFHAFPQQQHTARERGWHLNPGRTIDYLFNIYTICTIFIFMFPFLDRKKYINKLFDVPFLKIYPRSLAWLLSAQLLSLACTVSQYL